MFAVSRIALGVVVALAAASPALAAEPKVVWHKNLSEAYRVSVATKKPMLMCFTDASPFAAKQRQMFADGALDPFYDRAVFVYADPDNDDKFQNVKKKIEELGVKQFPTMVLLTPEKLEEIDRIEGNRSREEIQKSLLTMLRVPQIDWNVIQWEKPTWDADLAKAYDRAAAAKLPVVLLFLSPGCHPGKECACVKYARDLIPSAAFRTFADKAVYVLAEIPDLSKGDQTVANRIDRFLSAWNVALLPTLVVADPIPGGARERARIVGRFDPDLYLPRMAEAFDPKAETKLLPRQGNKPAKTDDLVQFLTERNVPFERTKDGGFRTTVKVSDFNGGQVELPVELRLSEDGRRIVVTATATDEPTDPAARSRFAETLAKAPRLLLATGPAQITTEDGKVRVTVEVFNDLSRDGVLAFHLMVASEVGSVAKVLATNATSGGKP